MCKQGNPEDCTEGLSRYVDRRHYPHKCDILTPNCKCHQWVFLGKYPDKYMIAHLLYFHLNVLQNQPREKMV